jgi:hypothetical protein
VRRPALTTIALAALAAAAVVAAVIVVGSPAASSAQERTATVEKGVIQSTVSGQRQPRGRQRGRRRLRHQR